MRISVISRQSIWIIRVSQCEIIRIDVRASQRIIAWVNAKSLKSTRKYMDRRGVAWMDLKQCESTWNIKKTRHHEKPCRFAPSPCEVMRISVSSRESTEIMRIDESDLAWNHANQRIIAWFKMKSHKSAWNHASPREITRINRKPRANMKPRQSTWNHNNLQDLAKSYRYVK